MPTLEYIRKKLAGPVRLWVIVAVAAALGVLWLVPHSGDPATRQAVMRWAKGGGVQETDEFLAAIHHEGDRGIWLSGAGHRPAKGDGVPADYAWPHVAVYSVANVRPSHPVPTLRDLSERAQVRAIDAIEGATGSAANPWNDLRNALSDSEEPGERDPYLFERVLVATVARGVKLPPGDRLVWTRILVHPINFRFAGYTIAATENETVKVSSVEATRVRKLSADISLAIPGVEGPKLGLSPTSESTVKTSSDVAMQYERLGIDIMPSFLRIIRESGAGGDVGGNTTVALAITTDPELVLQNARTRPPDPDVNLVVTGLHLDDNGKEPSMDVLPVVPLPHCALRAEVSMIYELRHVSDHRESYDESRQTVTFLHDVNKEVPVNIVQADDVSPFIWSIQIVPRGQKPNNGWGTFQALSARYDASGSWRQLVFSDYGRAVKLAHWIRTHPQQALAKYDFNWNPAMGLAVIKQGADDCEEYVARPYVPPPQ